jgi:hypothetical protein
MRDPQDSADLVQHVAAVNWIRSAILNNSKRVDPLQVELAKAFEGKSRRSKQAAATVSPLCLLGPKEKATFIIFTSSYHGINHVGFPRSEDENLSLDGCLRSFLCWLGDTNTRRAAEFSNERARPPASSDFVRRVQRRATTMDSTIERSFLHCGHSKQGGLPFAKS